MSKVGAFAIVIALFAISYFPIRSIVIAVTYYRGHTLLVADIRDILGDSSNENIVNVLARNTATNREINDRISKQDELLYSSLLIDSISFVAFIVSLVFGILQII